MEQENLDNTSGISSDSGVLAAFKKALSDYKENFSFVGFVYLPIATLSVLGIFIPGIVGAIFMFVSGILTALATPGFISAISKNFYPERATPLGKLKVLYVDGMKFIIPLLWVGILVALCVFFGTILLVIPGIWLSIVLGYSTYALIFDGRRGVDALAHSYIYAKNNFWFIFKRILFLGITLSVVGGLISGIFPPEKKLISEISGDKTLTIPAEVKNYGAYKIFFGEGEPYTYIRQPGDEALSAIFNNIFVIPFAMFFAVGIFKFIKNKNMALATEEKVKKTKNKIKLFAWLGILLPIVVLAILVGIFGDTVITSLRQILP